tara:strand:+ start:1558 stop:2226 length:669 start_codon:yes stop_codon:yes gene_type:complete
MILKNEILYPIPNVKPNSQLRLSILANQSVLYFYICIPAKKQLSMADQYNLPPPPEHPPELRRSPSHESYYYTSPEYLLNLPQKVLCKAVLNESNQYSEEQLHYNNAQLNYEVYYLSISAPPEIVLFESPDRWIKCTWRLCANGDIHYFVKKSISYNDHHLYINTLNEHHSILRAVYPQLVFAIIKFKILLQRVRRRINIRLFVNYSNYLPDIKKLVYAYVK